MAERFFDTSAFAKHYWAEVGTAKVDAFLLESGAHHFISTLGVVELHSVSARLVRGAVISIADFQLVRGRFLADIAARLWQVIPVAATHCQLAQQLVVRHGPTRSMRTLDAIQLAVAFLTVVGPLDAFVCADSDLGAIANSEGLAVVNPEKP